MNNAADLSRVVSELAQQRGRAQIYDSRNRSQPHEERPREGQSRSWAEDYGSGRRAPEVDAARHHVSGSGHRNGRSSSGREGRMDADVRRHGSALWREMMMSLCPGTRVFAVCVGITAFIFVI